ncbi:MAG: mechanosensitive ion channel family protein [Actinomycetota bacterium]|nr:mechanosensitive ion channel family protein [Actinomycetota bacterium]
MKQFLDLVLDNQTVLGRLVTTAVLIVVAVALAAGLGRLLSRKLEDSHSRYYSRKFVRYVVATLTLLALAIVWRAFAGRAAVVIGLAAAGLTFAMQEVVGAVAGWFNILSGRIFRVGDRIQMGGVRGDVIDITPLRTKILEMGSPGEDQSWVKGRQYTGRVVSISNKSTFTEPVFNYSAMFDFIWEELTIPIPYWSDWKLAEQILHEEAEKTSRSEGAEKAMRHMRRNYPIPRAEVEPRVFTRATDNWMELSARFVIPVRTARSVKDELTRRVIQRLRDSGIDIASETQDLRVEISSRKDRLNGQGTEE